ncbi:MAG: hypothetical protein Q9162_001808 [Coniocarpon cinnabarinum]
MAAAVGDSLDLSGRGYAQDPSAPDPVRPHPGDTVAAPRDEFTDLFNYDAQIDDVFRDTNDDGARDSRGNDQDEGRGLGIDEEVKVRKPRPKQAKLDENRLLGPKGLPELRKITKNRLKFRGKGHELWLDELFPKAKFADGLSIIEKVGHSRRMQIMRREWIDEERHPRATTPPADDVVSNDDANDGTGDAFMSGAQQTAVEDDGPLFVEQDEPNRPANNQRGEHDTQDSDGAQIPNENSAGAGSTLAAEEDDLDRLLAEEEAVAESGDTRAHEISGSPALDDFADDMEAMAAMDMA